MPSFKPHATSLITHKVVITPAITMRKLDMPHPPFLNAAGISRIKIAQ
jgi:hypothetical protein